MPRIAYMRRDLQDKTLALIDSANRIIDEYQGQGFTLTLRQLFYQFVARGLIENSQRAYKRLGSVVNDGRLLGMIDWSAIEDRTRGLSRNPFWDSPAHIIRADALVFDLDRWENQEVRIQVWVEKEALEGVFSRVCDKWALPLFSCRGYPSQSEVWLAARRFRRMEKNGQRGIILHFGDHDPSGIDMTRDIRDRLETFGCSVDLYRCALNMDQVAEQNPPPNPAKTTDSRSTGYIDRFGTSSWELDALEPLYLMELVEMRVGRFLDQDKWAETDRRVKVGRAELQEMADRYGEVAEYLGVEGFEDDEE